MYKMRSYLLLLVTVSMECALVRSASIAKQPRQDAANDEDAWCGQLNVGISVSSLVTNGRSRHLEVWWDDASPLPGEWVGLFAADPATTPGDLQRPLFATSTAGRRSGWTSTAVRQPDLQGAPALGYTTSCLGAWVAYISADNTTVLASNCLRTRPTWMADMNATISPLALHDIFLPGTHDSGSYNESNGKETIVTKYTITQEEDILAQLIYGIRYLDVRVGYYAYLTPQWWVNHGLFRIHPLQDLIDHVKTFVQATNEIVIVDIHEFPVGFGSNQTVHTLLERYLQEQLGSLATPKTLSWQSTLGAVWGSNKRVIVSYNNQDVVARSNWLWTAVAQKWGDVDTLDKLHSYLSGIMRTPPSDRAWAAMAELTASASQVIFDTLGGLRKMADSVNRNVTAWYKGSWGKTVNIVAVDFFRGGAIVDAAIRWNERRGARLGCPASSAAARVT